MSTMNTTTGDSAAFVAPPTPSLALARAANPCWTQLSKPATVNASNNAKEAEEKIHSEQNNSLDIFWEFSSFDAEGLKVYENGASLPVHLGDLYNQRYRVMLKIGYGAYSTIWLAVDHLSQNTHVVLKFLRRNNCEERNELYLYQYLRSGLSDTIQQRDEDQGLNPDGSHIGIDKKEGRKFVMSLLDSFFVQSRDEDEENTHKHDYTVLVAPVLLPFKLLSEEQRLQLDIKAHLFQLVQGVAYLHSMGITHGDLHPGNLALQIPSSQNDMEELYHYDPPRIFLVVPATASASRVLSYFPKYLVSSHRFPEYVKREAKDEHALAKATLKILDLSNAYRSPPSPLPSVHRSIRSPECTAHKMNHLILDSGGSPSDTWAAACTMFFLVFQRNLFRNIENHPGSVLWEFKQKIGPLPESWGSLEIKQPTIKYRHHDFVGTLESPDDFWMELKEEYQGPRARDTTLWEFLMLIRGMLCIDPALRPSMETVMMNKWFDDVRAIKG